MLRNRLRSVGVNALLLVGVSVGAFGCAPAPTGSQGVVARTSALNALSPIDILGFESSSDWTTNSGSLQSSPDATQGLASLAVVSPVNTTSIVSQPIGSNVFLASLELVPSGAIPIDLKLPLQQPNPYWYGAIQMYVSCPSLGVHNVYLGQNELTGAPLGKWATYWFTVPTAAGTVLQHQTFSDLTITVVLNVPSSGTGTYLLDNLGGSPVGHPAPNAFAMPLQTYVLPVFLVPTDYQTHAPAPDGVHDLSGGLWTTNSPGYSDFVAARNNVSVLIHQTRAFYIKKLQNPNTQAPRGMFSAASWNAQSGTAFVITSPPADAQQLEPLIVKSSSSLAQIKNPVPAGASPNEQYDYLGDVLTAAGCQQATCPFHFLVITLGDPFNPEGSRPLNLGTDNGGGFGLFNFTNFAILGRFPTAVATGTGCAMEVLPGQDEQSTLLHELGHNFGLRHANQYHDQDLNPATGIRFDQCFSTSVMGYNSANHIWNCKADSSQLCQYDQAWVDGFPGTLMPEDIRQLGQNQRAFFGLFFEQGLDAPGQTLFRPYFLNPPFIKGYGTLDAASGSTEAGNIGPYIAARGDQTPFLQFFDTFHEARAWRSTNVGAGNWASVTVDFPAAIQVTRVDVYAGAGSSPTITSIQITNAQGTVVGASPSAGFNQTVFLSGPATTSLQVALRAGATGQAVLRGLRLWGLVNGFNIELYPAAEPQVVAFDESSNAPSGGVFSLVGDTQNTHSFLDPFDPTRGWSGTTNSVGFLSLTVDFPEEVTLGSMAVHTGSDNSVASAANAVEIQRRCICPVAGKPTDVSWCSAGNADCAAAPSDGGVFETLILTSATPNTSVSFPTRTARRWKIAFRSPTPSTRLVVRGLQFFNPSGQELFPARVVIP